MKVKSVSTFFIVVFIIAMATAPAFALGEGNRNLLLIGVMGVSPLIILANFRFDKNDMLLLLFLATIILFPLIFHPESMRWSTVLYSWMFGLTFIAYKQLLHLNYFTVENYLKLLKVLILAYFIVLLIQQFCVLTGLPVFNLGNYNPAEPWKLNSLAAEPSHSARIVALLMYGYITTKEIIIGRTYSFNNNLKEDKWVWIGFLWTMVTMGSATAFLFLFVVFLKFISFRNLAPLLILFGLILFLVNQLEITAFERTYKTIIATLTLNEETIIKADHSAAMRIAPVLINIKMIDLTTLNGWFGHGVDYVSSYMYQMLPSVPEGVSGGGLFQLWLDYGFISFLIYVIFSLKGSYKKKDFISLFFWFFLVFMYGVNNQIVWLTLIILYTNKNFAAELKN